MGMFRTDVTIDGIICGHIIRSQKNGEYKLIFEREYATLEEIEAINWDQPTIVGDTILPSGYGFTVSDIQYAMSNDAYTVTLQVAEQYYGDVTGYQAQIASLQDTISQQTETINEQTETIQELEAEGSAVELKGELMEAYQEGVESNG